MKIDTDDIIEVITEVHKSDNFDKEFGIIFTSKCEYEISSNNKK